MKTSSLLRKMPLAFVLLAILQISSTFAQTAINETGTASANTSAALDVSSTTKGVLFPVMTDANRAAIAGPAAGLLIYNRTGGNFDFFDGTNWNQITSVFVATATNPAGAADSAGVGVGVSAPDPSALLEVNSSVKGFLLPTMTASPSSPATGLIYYASGATSNPIAFYNGTAWSVISSTVIGAGAGGSSTAAGLLVGPGIAATAAVSPSAKMEVRSSTTGLLIPRMTDAQRNAIPSPAEGLCLYSTTSNLVEFYSAGSWYQWSSSVQTYGTIVSNPGLSCKDILAHNSLTANVNGNGYYIKPNGTTYQCYCDMTTDGGGYTLVENTGPSQSNSGSTASVGAAPLSPASGGAFQKLSDADINAIRTSDGGYTTSIFRIYRQNSNVTPLYVYYCQNLVFNSAATNSTAIQTYYTNYAAANTQTGGVTPAYYSNGANGAFDDWNAASNPYKIMSNYGSEGWITNGNTTPAADRDEVNVQIWVK